MNSSQLDISWNPPTTPNGVITHYTLYTIEVIVVSASDGETTYWYSLTGLHPNLLVSVVISASTSAGEGPLSDPVEKKTPEAPCMAPLCVSSYTSPPPPLCKYSDVIISPICNLHTIQSIMQHLCTKKHICAIIILCTCKRLDEWPVAMLVELHTSWAYFRLVGPLSDNSIAIHAHVGDYHYDNLLFILLFQFHALQVYRQSGAWMAIP